MSNQRTNETRDLVRRLDLGQVSHRAIGNKIDSLDQALALDLPDEARAAVQAERDKAVVEAERLIAELAAASKAAPVLLYDQHGRVVGRAKK